MKFGVDCTRVGLVFPLLIGIANLIGCGPSSPTATGKVTYENELIAKGNITFSPASGGPIVGAEIVKGTYSVTGLTAGKSRVSVIAVKDVPFARSSEEMAKMAETQKIKGNDSGLIDPADIIPENAKGNNQEIEIKAGNQVLDFNLSKPGK